MVSLQDFLGKVGEATQKYDWGGAAMNVLPGLLAGGAAYAMGGQPGVIGLGKGLEDVRTMQRQQLSDQLVQAETMMKLRRAGYQTPAGQKIKIGTQEFPLSPIISGTSEVPSKPPYAAPKGQRWKPTLTEKVDEYGQPTWEGVWTLEGIPTGKEKTKRVLPSPSLTKIDTLDNAISQTQYALDELKNNKELSGYLGPIAGRVPYSVRQLTGMSPAYASWYAEVEKAFQVYRQMVTGAQASDRELRMLRPLLPGPSDTPEQWTAKAQTVIERAKKAREKYIGTLGKAGYDVEGFQEFSDYNIKTPPSEKRVTIYAIDDKAKKNPKNIPEGQLPDALATKKWVQ